MRLVESMQRQLPVLLAREVVASSTRQTDPADNTFKDKKRSEEPSVVGAPNKACEVQVTITIKIEKGKDQTISKTQISRDKRDNNESSSECEDTHKGDEQRKKEAEEATMKFDFPVLRSQKIKVITVPHKRLELQQTILTMTTPSARTATML